MSARAAKVRQARKANPLLRPDLQIAPLHVVAPVRCAREGCADPRLIHREDGRCLRVGCDCQAYEEGADSA